MKRVISFLSVIVCLLATSGLATAVPIALTPSTTISIDAAGNSSILGTVSTGHNIYDFFGTAGDAVTLEIDAPATSWDDSQLFLFNSTGKLLAENDDILSWFDFRSRINFTLPANDTYYIGVTSYDNDPNLDGNNIIINWQDDGGDNFTYTLNVSGVTPVPEPSTLLLFGSGLFGVLLKKRG